MRTLTKTICLSVSLISALTGAASLHAQVKILTGYERLTIQAKALLTAPSASQPRLFHFGR